MTSDSTPVFALEKEALKTEIETGLQVGVDHLEDKPMKRKPVEKYHNTRYLLKQYRKVAYAIQISESDMNVRMEMEHGTRLSTLEVNAELAGVDLSGSKLEGYARTVIRSKNIPLRHGCRRSHVWRQRCIRFRHSCRSQQQSDFCGWHTYPHGGVCDQRPQLCEIA